MQKCNLCPRKCNVLRTDREGGGFCKSTKTLKIARASLHFGEEPFISGKNGSGTIFFSGCSLGCVFCQNAQISQNLHGKEISVERLSDIFKELEEQGANNINFVTASHYIDKIEEALSKYRPSIPLILNSSGYESVSIINKDIFDVYLFDLKFFSSEKSKKYAACPDYFNVASLCIKEAVNFKGKPVFTDDGMIKSGVAVRHLLLPQGTEESKNIIEWLNTNTPDIIFSLMSQYVPMHKASAFKELNRKITKREYDKVCEFLFDKNFFDIYVQNLKSSTTEYIPEFDLSGV